MTVLNDVLEREKAPQFQNSGPDLGPEPGPEPEPGPGPEPEPGAPPFVPTLDDAAYGSGPGPDLGPEPEPEPLTNDQIIGLVAEISAVGLPPEQTDAYKTEFTSNQMINLGVQASGLSDALAKYGVNAGGGKLPEWLSVLLGVSVLGYGIYSIRGKHAANQQGSAANFADNGWRGSPGDPSNEGPNVRFNQASNGEVDTSVANPY